MNPMKDKHPRLQHAHLRALNSLIKAEQPCQDNECSLSIASEIVAVFDRHELTNESFASVMASVHMELALRLASAHQQSEYLDGQGRSLIQAVTLLCKLDPTVTPHELLQIPKELVTEAVARATTTKRKDKR